MSDPKLSETYKEDLPHLQALRHEPFAPIGWLYTSIFESLVEKKLVRRCGRDSYELSTLGRQVLQDAGESATLTKGHGR